MARLGHSRGFCSLVVLLSGTVLHWSSAQINRDTDSPSEDPVSWEVAKWGPCTAPCGGGLQIRTVRCVQHVSWPGYPDVVKLQALNSKCPQPGPAMSQACNNHSCLAKWTAAPWTECSATCGMGTQTRQVRCESIAWSPELRLPDGAGHQVSGHQCAGPMPQRSRVCHLADCPFLEEPGRRAILAEEYTLWQLGRAKTITAQVGTEINLLPGQDLVVKCPVREKSLEKMRYWSKDNKLLLVFGDHLHIRDANPVQHAGTYTCMAHNDNATVTINFVKKNNPLPQLYKKWIRKSKRKKKTDRLLETTRTGQGASERLPRRGSRLSISHDTNSRPNRQGDQSKNDKNSRKRAKRNKNNTPMHTPVFLRGDWSECENATCAATGQKSREVKCVELDRKYVKVLSEDRCEKDGLVKPDSSSKCNYRGVCPVWRTGPWSKCSPHCGWIGHSRRYLSCEWSDTGTSAFSACDKKQKPKTKKMCKPVPCTSLKCEDKSRSCDLASHLRMCRYIIFRRQCCHSCRERRRNPKSKYKRRYYG